VALGSLIEDLNLQKRIYTTNTSEFLENSGVKKLIEQLNVSPEEFIEFLQQLQEQVKAVDQRLREQQENNTDQEED